VGDLDVWMRDSAAFQTQDMSVASATSNPTERHSFRLLGPPADCLQDRV